MRSLYKEGSPKDYNVNNMSTPNLEVVLKRIDKALTTVDEKTKQAKAIKKELEEAYATCEAEGKTILKAILNVELFLMSNTIEGLEAGKERLKAQLNQVLGMVKLTKQIKTKAKKQPPTPK